MTARTLILGASLVLVAALLFFLVRDLVLYGVTPLGVVSVPVVVILGAGVIGAMGTPPRR